MTGQHKYFAGYFFKNQYNSDAKGFHTAFFRSDIIATGQEPLASD